MTKDIAYLRGGGCGSEVVMSGGGLGVGASAPRGTTATIDATGCWNKKILEERRKHNTDIIIDKLTKYIRQV